jgi:hypothetical protein
MTRRRRDRIFLPGWWKFWEAGPQWSSTARQRLGMPTPTPSSGGDFRLWESELRQAPGQTGAGTGGDTLTGADLTATFGNGPGPGPAARPSPVDDLADEVAARRRARDAKDKNGGEGP